MIKKILKIYLIVILIIIVFLFVYKVISDYQKLKTIIKKGIQYKPISRYVDLKETIKLQNIQGRVLLVSDTGLITIIKQPIEVKEGSIIEVDGNSSAECLSQNGILLLEDNTKIKVAKVFEKTLLDYNEIKFELKEGKVTANVWGSLTKKLTFEIKTPVAVVGVRGTKFQIVSLNKISTIKCFEGTIFVFDNNRNFSFLKEGQMTQIIENNQKIKIDTFAVENEYINWFDETMKYKEEKIRSERDLLLKEDVLLLKKVQEEPIIEYEKNYELQEYIKKQAQMRMVSEETKQNNEEKVEITNEGKKEEREKIVPLKDEKEKEKTESVKKEETEPEKAKGKKDLEEYVINKYKKQYGADWEKKYNADKEANKEKKIDDLIKTKEAEREFKKIEKRFDVDRTKQVKDYIR
ncbi:MAG TPA: FecR domain-containing protein [bacterium]|nr:FecR domain-containing protein [bacterium]HOL47014.1 FecR domain-containing protein [bacterium]HPQ18484.1 FecR domain-containing protein [bacterium]